MSIPSVTGGWHEIGQNEVYAFSNLFTVSDPDGDPIVQYAIVDFTSVAGSGFITLNGVVQAAGTPFIIAASDLPNVLIHGGANLGLDALQIRAWDSTGAVSNWTDISLNTHTVISGGGGNDVITGTAGDDFLNGGAGNDTIDGAGGRDVATYSGSRSNYTITPNHGSFNVTGPDGSDTLTNVEQMSFADGSIKLLGSSAHASGADFYGDGSGSILWRSDSGQIALWQLNGSSLTGGGFVFGGNVIPTDFQIEGSGDFSGDGRADIMWRATDGRVAVSTLNGTSITGGGFVAGGVQIPLDWSMTGVADFNGDGKADMLWHGQDGRAAIWTMDGSTLVSAVALNGGAAIPTDWQIAGVGDFSGDGKGDILWRNADGRIAEWSMNGATIIGGGVAAGGIQVPADWSIAGIGDFSGDHKADILWHAQDGRAAMWMMDGANLVSAQALNGGAPIPTDWQVVGVGDFSHDGKADILFKADDGRIAEWTMNGATIIGGGIMTSTLPQDWIVT